MCAAFLYQPRKPVRRVKIRTIGTTLSSKGKETLEYLTQSGVPIHREQFRKIRAKALAGGYRGHHDQLVHDVKSDPGLFYYTVQHMKQVSEGAGAIDPIESLRTLEEEKVAQLFDVSSSQISTHRLDQANRLQALRLQQIIYSSQAAERFAREAQLVDSEAFSAAALRQLGEDLIAWNYPSIYSRVTTRHRMSGVPTEQEFLNLLGITPQQIGKQLASEWGVKFQIQQAFTKNPTSPFDRLAQGRVQPTLADLCEIAEEAAKAKDPLHYPEEAAAFAKHRELVQQTFGETVLDDVEAGARGILEPYSDVEHISQVLAIGDLEHEGILPGGGLSLEENRHLRSCLGEIRAAFAKVYERIPDQGIAVDAVRELVDRAVHVLPFRRGCLYLLQEESYTLVPALRFGDIPLEHYIQFLKRHKGRILNAMNGIAPYRAEEEGVSGEDVRQICGPLVNNEHPGVLYMEEGELPEDYVGDTLHLFHVVRETLNHCFGVR